APGLAFNFKLEPSRKTNCTQHSQAVFRETLRRIADGADQFRFQIGPATDEIDHFVLHGIEKHSVDREIAPPRIFLWRGKMNLARTTSVQINIVGTEGRDFELESVFQNDNDSEVRADRISAREQFLHFLRARVGGDVDVFRRKLTHHVAHAAAGEGLAKRTGKLTRRKSMT